MPCPHNEITIVDVSKLPENITGPVKINGLIKTTDIPEASLINTSLYMKM